MSYEEYTPEEELEYDFEDKTPLDELEYEDLPVEEPVVELEKKEKKKSPFVIIFGEDLEKEIKTDVKNTQDILCVSESETKILLSFYNWNSEKLTVDFFEKGMKYLFQKAGITINNTENKSNISSITCHGCFEDDVPIEKASKLSGCEHTFCNECWKGYITSKINQNNLNIKCMYYKCDSALKDDFIQKFVNSEVKEKFKLKLVDDYVATNKLVKWCPSKPHCGYAVKIIDSISTTELPIICKCGQTFCFTCLEDIHTPASCEMVQKWKIKTDKESLNLQWINNNTKKCPKCSNPIEKNGGCNHMTCSKCFADFCWICSSPNYFNHICTYGTYKKGDYFNQGSIDRDIHFLNKHQNHANSYIFEIRGRGRIVSMINDENKWLRIPAEILVECRRAILNSYIFAYYQFDIIKLLANKKDKKVEKELKTLEIYELLFDNHLKQLEHNTEKLSNFFELNNVSEVDKNQNSILETVDFCKKAARGLLEVIKKQQMGEYQAK